MTLWILTICNNKLVMVCFIHSINYTFYGSKLGHGKNKLLAMQGVNSQWFYSHSIVAGGFDVMS